MSDFEPYSEKQQILTAEQWESMGFLPQDCLTTKVAADLMRAVVTRLLKIDKTGKNVNIDDFEFLVYDDSQPNAGFISGYKTKNHKNIVTVSTGITKLCKNEDELAGVLAHELGHFTYSKIYGDNKNTVFQERFSDLHALDLMIAGGYDPVAYSNVCDEMRGFGTSLFDVHGSGVARKEDVDAYLTKLHKEQGDFKVLPPTGGWGKFVKIMAIHPDVYKSYFTLLLEHNFPKVLNNRDYRPPVSRVFDLILSELRKGNLNTARRMDDMLDYIKGYKYTEREIQSTQNFLEQLVDIYNQDAAVQEHLRSWEIVALSKELKQNFRGNRPFKVFPPIDEDVKKIHEFMTTRDINRVKELAHDLWEGDRIFDIGNIKEVFDAVDGFKMPPRATAKGQLMPTDWLWNVCQKVDFDTRVYIHRVLDNIGVDCDYKWMTDKRLDAGLLPADSNYGGKIIATNEREIEKLRAKLDRQNTYTSNYMQFECFMRAIEILYSFDQGQISATDVVRQLWEYAVQSDRMSHYYIGSMLHWLGSIQLMDYRHENPYLEFELKALDSSKEFAEFYIKPFLEMLKQSMRSISPRLASKIHTDNPPRGKTWLEYLLDVTSKYMKLKKDISIYVNRDIQLEGELIDSLGKIGRQIGIQDKDDMLGNVSAGPIVQHISGITSEKLHNVIIKFIHSAVQEGVYSDTDAATMFHTQFDTQHVPSNWGYFSENRTIRNMGKLEKQVNDKLVLDTIEQFSIYANGEQWVRDQHVRFLESLYIEIKEKTDLHKIRRLLMAFGMLANNDLELINIMAKPTPQVDSEKIYPLEAMLKECALTYYMRKNSPIKDLYPVLFALRNDRVAIFRDTFTDELADYMETNHLMPTDFQSMFKMNAVMQKLNVFSKERSNHAKVLNFLVAQIEKMPQIMREDYAWKLLSGFYYSDDDAEHVVLNRVSDDMGYPLVRNKLLEIYSDAVAKRLGRDDNSNEYFSKIQELSDFINQKHQYVTNYNWERNGINKTTQGKLYRLISDKIQSQERVSQYLANDKNIVLSDSDAQDHDRMGRGVETLLDELAYHKELSIYSIEFLNRKLTTKSIEKYRQQCAEYSEDGNVAKMIKPSILENLYHTFWASGLEVRAVIMNKLLNRGFETLDGKIKYVCDMNFGKDSKYRADAEMICDCVIKSFEPYEQDLILAAIASADENKEEGKNASRSVGDGLRMFFENMGPAWVKFGQLLSYVPDLPSEIRHDLGKLKDRADMPARWDVYTWLRGALPDELYNRIDRVEDIVGAGSFWMTAIIQFKNEQGISEKKVIQLLRPNADARANAGFKTIETAIDKLSKRDSAYKMLRNVAHQAHDSAKYEVDADIGNKQYEKAKDLYGDIRVSIDGTQYTPHVADWRYFGTGKGGMAYKIMDFAPGATLSRVNVDDNERRKMALAYFTIEMVNLFKGDVWDIDRHQGQQNFDIVSPTHVDINIYDTGAQLPKAPDNKNKVLLANIFFGLTQAVQSGTPIDTYLLKIIKRLDKLQNMSMDVSYVSNVQKGLMALSDIIEYQKELKSPDGRIIQERKTLSPDDLKHAILAVLQNPTVDKYIDMAIKGRVVINKASHFQIKELKELARGTALDTDNPVKIIITDKDATSRSRRIKKATEEIAKLEKDEDSILGISKKYIDQSGTKTPISPDNSQKVA